MKAEEAMEFCARWLPLWTGNRPEELAAMYADDLYYRDPGRPQGIRGRADFLAYLRKLLARFPDWRWEAVETFPLEGGFVLRWRAAIPVEGREVTEEGLDLVFVRDGRITRNEVFFDRSALR